MKPDPAILYEDDDILAVNKPAGVLTHPDGKSDEKTLADWFIEKYPEAKDLRDPYFDDEEKRSSLPKDVPDILGLGEKRGGIVHRLDKDTSGVILLAKTQKGVNCLKNQFQDRTVKKMYHAIVIGTPHTPRGMIDADVRWRKALTEYIVLESAKGYALVQAMPKTGRTHQIRVHLQAIGHPIAADPIYGTAKNDLGLSRTALHAKVIEFDNCRGVRTRVEASYPRDFEEALARAGLSA